MGLDNPLHIAFLLIVLLVVFGARRLPEIGRSIGAGMREFKDSVSGQTPMITPPQAQAQPPAQPVNAQAAQAFSQQPANAQATEPASASEPARQA